MEASVDRGEKLRKCQPVTFMRMALLLNAGDNVEKLKLLYVTVRDVKWSSRIRR